MGTQTIDFSDLGGRRVQAAKYEQLTPEQLTRFGLSPSGGNMMEGNEEYFLGKHASQPINFSDLGERPVEGGRATLASLLQGAQPTDAGDVVASSVARPQPPRALTRTKAPAAGPFAEPGAYERWAREQISPSDSLKETGKAVLETAGGVVGAPAVAEYSPAIASALAPLAKKYGIKALEGAGLGAGYELYHELKKVFEGK